MPITEGKALKRKLWRTTMNCWLVLVVAWSASSLIAPRTTSLGVAQPTGELGPPTSINQEDANASQACLQASPVGRSIFPVEAPSFRMTLACVNLTSTRQPGCITVHRTQIAQSWSSSATRQVIKETSKRGSLALKEWMQSQCSAIVMSYLK